MIAQSANDGIKPRDTIRVGGPAQPGWHPSMWLPLIARSVHVPLKRGNGSRHAVLGPDALA
jgi:hypothetical protein